MTSEAVRAAALRRLEREQARNTPRRFIQEVAPGIWWRFWLHPTKGWRRERVTGRASLPQDQTHER